jgi:cation:H+ antiporter
MEDNSKFKIQNSKFVLLSAGDTLTANDARIPTAMTFETLLPWLLVTGGILCLGLGGSWLVDGASRIALKLGISPMVVGLTVVGFGTSMPEFAVSVMAALRGSGGLSLGNAVGSNIMNLLLVLGVAAVLVPIHVIGSRRLLYRDLTFGLVPAVVLIVFARKGFISQSTALLLLAIFTVFIVTTVLKTRGHSTEPAVVAGTLPRHFALTTIGIAVLIGGSEMLVIGGVDLARRFGVSEALVGLTVVAFGTSLPELATSVVAVLKGQIPILVAATFVVGLFVLRDGRINRWEGGLMLILFAAYLVFLGIRIA